MNFRVLDLSAHQGDIDFSRVKKDGTWGVMLKATEGQSYLSPAFDKNYEQAIKAGLHVGAYHYLRAANALDSLKEAQFFLQSVKGKQLTLPLAVDIEAPEQKPIRDLAPIAKTFCQELERQKYYAVLYSMVSWFRTKLSSKELNAYDRWIAHVGVSAPKFDKPYGMWQFTWEAKVDGILGNVDENVCYKNYPQILKKAGLNHLNG